MQEVEKSVMSDDQNHAKAPTLQSHITHAPHSLGIITRNSKQEFMKKLDAIIFYHTILISLTELVHQKGRRRLCHFSLN